MIEKQIGKLTFYINGDKVAVKVGLQTFRIHSDFITRHTSMKEVIKSIENEEIKNIDDLYGYMKNGYMLSQGTIV